MISQVIVNFYWGLKAIFGVADGYSYDILRCLCFEVQLTAITNPQDYSSLPNIEIHALKFLLYLRAPLQRQVKREIHISECGFHSDSLFKLYSSLLSPLHRIGYKTASLLENL